MYIYSMLGRDSYWCESRTSTLIYLYVYYTDVTLQVEKILMEFETGERVSLNFTAAAFSSKYHSHIAALAEMYRCDPNRLEAHCRKVAQTLL